MGWYDMIWVLQAGCTNMTVSFSGVGLQPGVGQDVARVVTGNDCRSTASGTDPPGCGAKHLSGNSASPSYSAAFQYGGNFAMCYKVPRLPRVIWGLISVLPVPWVWLVWFVCVAVGCGGGGGVSVFADCGRGFREPGELPGARAALLFGVLGERVAFVRGQSCGVDGERDEPCERELRGPGSVHDGRGLQPRSAGHGGAGGARGALRHLGEHLWEQRGERGADGDLRVRGDLPGLLHSGERELPHCGGPVRDRGPLELHLEQPQCVHGESRDADVCWGGLRLLRLPLCEWGFGPAELAGCVPVSLSGSKALCFRRTARSEW